MANCTHNESRDIALVPARREARAGFNILAGGKMGSGGFTIAQPLDGFVEPAEAAEVTAELVRIFRDHGPREARSKCRLAHLIEDWGIQELRYVLCERLSRTLEQRLAACGNHQAADIGFRGLKANIDGQLVEAVAIYAGGWWDRPPGLSSCDRLKSWGAGFIPRGALDPPPQNQWVAGGFLEKPVRSATIGACPAHPPRAPNRAGLHSWPSCRWAGCIGFSQSL